jgi:hypothetical protein
MRRIPSISIALLSCAAPLLSQFLTVPPGPAAPGSTIAATYHNNTALVASHPLNSSPVSLLSDEGELIAPRLLSNQGITWMSTYPGSVETFVFTTPATGPGSSGSFVLLYPWAPAAVGRLDVATPSATFASIHPFPPSVHLGFGTHAVAFGTSASWAVGNTSPLSFAFGAADQVQVFAPGGSVALASQSLAGVVVPPGAVVPVPLPLANLTPGPYTVAMSWTDPSSGFVVRRFGIHEAPYADLYLPSGKFLPFGGSIDLFTNCDFLAPSGFPLSFIQLADVSSGTSALPGGQLIPIVPDFVSIACITSSLSGLLVNGQGGTFTLPAVCYGYCGPMGGPLPARYLTPTTTLLHPNVGGLGGLVVRLATLLYDLPGSRFVATQGEEVVLG